MSYADTEALALDHKSLSSRTKLQVLVLGLQVLVLKP